ncbi:hypothetical protein A2524_03055 [Candidatus Wolfebacteria bacterium RIFOXYD12_FULL_48_21]|uniref:Uncharacterized protein n=1 Tax=Candidatus Wolfebacteria bacterium RIFOXYD1_FULL_48_65 TaxID=1802561 RepID=A0A1F8E259_9BACT|nr:MAG: hypothetical protein A2610_02105 [Candidatus Wolfebacteria bacterium RIFOXYD1_FULL_48_65]OGM95043.1 MAG: hypothetical protein A2524_03055 [Candidatus Wolfebacteria bacterium RIFOXYD12_FULL_48_21]
MKHTRGFSLLETLLYLGIFAIIGGSLFGILTNVVRISTQEISGDEVSSQLQFAMETVSRLVRESSAIETATTTTGTLKLRMNDPALDPTCVFVQNGVLKLSQGPDEFQKQNCASASTDLTTSKVIVDTAFFKRVEFSGGHDQVSVDLQFSNTATGPSKISRALRSGISRVSAATFDSDLLPNADDSYEVGFSGTKRWKNISLSNLLNLGIISADPFGIDGSIYYNSTSKSFRGKANGTWGDIGSSLWMATSTNSMYSNITGNVGIGNTNPGSSRLRVSHTQAGAWATLIENTVPNDSWGLTVRAGDSSTNAALSVMDRSSTNYYLYIRGDGNIGIGTTAPATKLVVRQSTNAFTGGLAIENVGGVRGLYVWVDGSNNGRIDSGSGGNAPLILNSGGGNVGIDASAPTQKLDVNGTAKATQINSGNYCDINGANCKTITAMAGGTPTIEYGPCYVYPQSYVNYYKVCEWRVCVGGTCSAWKTGNDRISTPNW